MPDLKPRVPEAMTLRNPQKLNLYPYCLDNPLRLVDPTGNEEEEAKERQKPPPTHVDIPRIIVHWMEKMASFFGIELWTTKEIRGIAAAAESGEPGGEDPIQKMAQLEAAKRAFEYSKGIRPREMGERWSEFQREPEKWDKVAEMSDARQPKGGMSVRELWRNKETGELMENHILRQPRPPRTGHPHPKEAKWSEWREW